MAGQFASLVPYSTATISNNANLAQIANTNPAYTQAAQAQAALNNAGSGGGGGGGGPSAAQVAAQQAAAANAQRISAINAAYQPNTDFYNNELSQVDPQKQQDIRDTNGIYDSQLHGLSDQRDAAFANLDQQTNVANQSYGRSLQQLGNSIRNQYQGQSNQLGTQGAGDSSATNMLGYALGQQNNLQRSYMNQDLNNQLTQVGLARDADQKQFQDQSDQVQALRQGQLSAIGEKYQALVNQINGAIVNNESARRNALNYAGQWAASQAAGVDQNIAGALNAAKSNTALMPQVGHQDMASYTAHNIVAPTVPVQSSLSTPQTTEAPQQQIYSPYYKDPNQGF